MPAHKIMLTSEERQSLEGLLQRVLNETRVEEHRTRTPSYREHVIQEEHLLQSVLSKLRQAGE